MKRLKVVGGSALKTGRRPDAKADGQGTTSALSSIVGQIKSRLVFHLFGFLFGFAAKLASDPMVSFDTIHADTHHVQYEIDGSAFNLSVPAKLSTAMVPA